MVKMFARHVTTLLPGCQANKAHICNLQCAIYIFKPQGFTKKTKPNISTAFRCQHCECWSKPKCYNLFKKIRFSINRTQKNIAIFLHATYKMLILENKYGLQHSQNCILAVAYSLLASQNPIAQRNEYPNKRSLHTKQTSLNNNEKNNHRTLCISRCSCS